MMSCIVYMCTTMLEDKQMGIDSDTVHIFILNILYGAARDITIAVQRRKLIEHRESCNICALIHKSR